MTTSLMQTINDLPTLDDEIRSTSDAMANFCEGDQTFVFGQFKAWRQACIASNHRLDPADFKKPQGILA